MYMIYVLYASDGIYAGGLFQTQARIVPTASRTKTIQDFLCSSGRAPLPTGSTALFNPVFWLVFDKHSMWMSM